MPLDISFGEIHRALAPGGRLFAAMNGDDHRHELATLIRQFTPDADIGVKTQILPFSLKNGSEQPERHFVSVNLERYEDGFAVTEAEPLVAYVLSIGAKRLSSLAWLNASSYSGANQPRCILYHQRCWTFAAECCCYLCVCPLWVYNGGDPTKKET